MALARSVPAPRFGHATPRIAPPIPARHGLPEFKATSATMGIELMPWQETAGRYITAIGPDGRLMFREVAVLVARQNGKTTLMKPYIIGALRAGLKVMHIAQTRELPRHMFDVVADALSAEPELFPKRRGKVIWPRYGAGQEEIRLLNGGMYRIAAARSGGARGWSNDRLIIDELREMESYEILNAAEPTLTMSPDPQIVYLSNEGHENSVVLNAVRARAGQDESLAFLSWSADPERPADDRDGWLEANPAFGHYPAVERTLEAAYRRHSLGGTMPIFETEHLCRSVPTMREPMVDLGAWTRAAVDELESPVRPFMGICLDPSGARASAAIAWPREDGTIALRLLFDVTGDPIDTDRLGKDLRDKARELGVSRVGFDPLTDAVLAKFFRRTEPISGAKFANASARFTTAIDSRKLAWTDCAAIGEDLTFTAKKPHDESGSFQAVRADDARPITAALAAIRAVWLASAPRPEPTKARPQTVGF